MARVSNGLWRQANRTGNLVRSPRRVSTEHFVHKDRGLVMPRSRTNAKGELLADSGCTLVGYGLLGQRICRSTTVRDSFSRTLIHRWNDVVETRIVPNDVAKREPNVGRFCRVGFAHAAHGSDVRIGGIFGYASLWWRLLDKGWGMHKRSPLWRKVRASHLPFDPARLVPPSGESCISRIAR